MPYASMPPVDSTNWPDFLAAPPLSDVVWFPTAHAVQAARDFNERHRAWLSRELQYEWDPYRRSILGNWQKEALELYRIWNLLGDVHFVWYEPWRRRVALKRLRDILGEKAYYTGRMPPVVPVWRFREMSR